MKLATTTGDFQCYCATVEQCMDYLLEAGFRHADLSLYSPTYCADLLESDDWQSRARQIKEHAERIGMDFLQSHAPATRLLMGTDKDKEDAIRWTTRTLEVCAFLGIPNSVVHGGVDWSIKSKDEWTEKSLPFFRALIPTMEKTGVKVLFENSASFMTGNSYYPNTGADICEFLDHLDHPLFGVCWDTGHANIEGAQYDQIRTIGQRLGAVHFNDNLGTKDEHTIPMLGTVNVDEVMNALIDVGFGGPLTFESGSALRPYKYWVGDRRPFDRDQRLANPTLNMQRSIERFMYDLGVEVLRSYDLFEE